MTECPKCGAEFEAEGKIARCPECQATFKNNPIQPKAKAKPKKEEPKPKPAPAPVVTDDMYGFSEDVDLAAVRKKREEEDAKKAEEKKKNEPKHQISVRRKNIGDLEAWAKVDRAMIFFLAGVCVWGASHFLYGLMLFLGMVQGPEYAGPVVRFLIHPEQPPLELGQGDVLDRASFVMAMLAGSNLVTTAYVLSILVQVLSWIQTGLWVAGYAIAWQGVPAENGAKGQLTALYSLAGLNFLFNFFFQFLPLVGAYTYVMMPLMGHELSMAEFNMERTTSIPVFWSYSPFWETLFAFVIFGCRFAEPALIAYFIWTVAYLMKEEPLDESARTVIAMGGSVFFLLLAYLLFSISGTSPVLVKLLRLLYLLWYAFIVVWILRLAALTSKCRETFRFYFFPDQD